MADHYIKIINYRRLGKILEPMVADNDTEEAKEIIHNDKTHVAEMWEDGEITSTKSGDLYGRRSLHQQAPPLLADGQLWEVPDNRDHKRRVIIDPKAREIIEALHEAIAGSTDAVLDQYE